MAGFPDWAQSLYNDIQPVFQQFANYSASNPYMNPQWIMNDVNWGNPNPGLNYPGVPGQYPQGYSAPSTNTAAPSHSSANAGKPPTASISTPQKADNRTGYNSADGNKFFGGVSILDPTQAPTPGLPTNPVDPNYTNPGYVGGNVPNWWGNGTGGGVPTGGGTPNYPTYTANTSSIAPAIQNAVNTGYGVQNALMNQFNAMQSGLTQPEQAALDYAGKTYMNQLGGKYDQNPGHSGLQDRYAGYMADTANQIGYQHMQNLIPTYAQGLLGASQVPYQTAVNSLGTGSNLALAPISAATGIFGQIPYEAPVQSVGGGGK